MLQCACALSSVLALSRGRQLGMHNSMEHDVRDAALGASHVVSCPVQPEACDTLPTCSTYMAGHAGCAVSMLLEVIAAGVLGGPSDPCRLQ